MNSKIEVAMLPRPCVAHPIFSSSPVRTSANLATPLKPTRKQMPLKRQRHDAKPIWAYREDENHATVPPLVMDNTLFRLTYALQAKLPCELRDIVYNHVFDANTMREVHDYVFGSLDMKMDMIEVPLSSWPLYLYGGYTDEHIRVELIRYFCEHDPHLAVQHPRDLGALLRKEILASGIRLEHCALSALQISGCIHLRTVDEFLDPKTILSEFAPLLSASQNFAASFRLTFHLHPYTDDILDHLEEIASENRKFRFEYLAVRMRNLGPAVRHIEERLKESGASRKVEVKLEFKRARHEDVVLEVSDEMMRSGWHGGKWAHLIIGWDECNQIRR